MSELRKKILTVEDAPHIRRLIAYNLRRAGYDVYEAQNGREAVKVLQRMVPDLIILDVRMPEMDGFQLLGLMKKYPRAAAIPVIMMTALSQPSDIERARKLGVVEYLVKPLEPQVLIEKAHRALEAVVEVETYEGGERRLAERASILEASMSPFPGGRGIDISTAGIGWRTAEPPADGDIVVIEAPELFEELEVSETTLRCRVVYSLPLETGGFRVGAALVGLAEGAKEAIAGFCGREGGAL